MFRKKFQVRINIGSSCCSVLLTLKLEARRESDFLGKSVVKYDGQYIWN